MTQRYFEGGWYREPALRGFGYLKAGYYEEGTEPEHDVVLTDQMLLQLVPVLEQYQFITPRIDDRGRAEDLKITHRLIDLLDKAVTQ